MTQVISVNISVDETSDLDQTVEALVDAGLRVNRVLPALRVVTGSAEPRTLQDMSFVPGVLHVNEEHAVRAARFGSFLRRYRSHTSHTSQSQGY